LQERLFVLSPERYAAMNNSDRHNPRRLQRAVEIAMVKTTELPATELQLIARLSHHYVGITISDQLLFERIKARITHRLKQGVVAEVLNFQKKYPYDCQAKSSLGFAEISEYGAGSLDEQTTLDRWLQAEVAYAKRQLTWWRKQPSVTWFAVDNGIRAVVEWLAGNVS
jgi:tRNA dimethylallyltransferase